MKYEAKYKISITSDVGYFKLQCKLNGIRNVLKGEGFKRLFWSRPFNEIYSDNMGTEAKIILEGTEKNSGSRENGILPYSYEKISVVFNKNLSNMDRGLVNRIWKNI